MAVKTEICATNRVHPELVGLRTDLYDCEAGIVVSDAGVYVRLEDFPRLIDAMIKFYADVKAELAVKAAIDAHRKALCP